MKRTDLVKTLLTVAIIGCSYLSSAQSTTYSFVHESVTRSYIVHLPPGYPDGSSYSLVINMHGYGTTASLQESFFGMSDVADTANFIVVYPDGIVDGTSPTWNAGQLWAYAVGIDDVSFISDLIDTLVANFTIDTNKVYATGMSNGGFMSYRLACELDQKIAAIASVTGVMSDSVYYSCQTSRPVPVMHMHGTTDPTVNFNGEAGQQSVDSCISFWVQRNNCSPIPITISIPDTNLSDLCTAEKFVYGQGDNDSEVILFKITGGGHTWPGGPDLSGFGFGNTNMDFNANAEIWLFFRRHSLSTPNSAAQKETYKKPDIRIWPNPNSGALHIDGISGNAEITVVNMLAQIVQIPISVEPGTHALTLDITNLEAGIYLLKVTSSEYSTTRRLIKQ